MLAHTGKKKKKKKKVDCYLYIQIPIASYLAILMSYKCIVATTSHREDPTPTATVQAKMACGLYRDSKLKKYIEHMSQRDCSIKQTVAKSSLRDPRQLEHVPCCLL